MVGAVTEKKEVHRGCVRNSDLIYDGEVEEIIYAYVIICIAFFFPKPNFCIECF